ncbi:MAG TPA: TetR/AcrR family transcriptional regulator [Candidatus Binatia bacterium]
MKHSLRLASEDRRQAIVEAVRGVFAENGFHGSTTRELAKTAGVSEALIYKHFPSKRSLYMAMLEACANGPTFAEFNRILALQPSTSTLVVMVHFTMAYYIEAPSWDPDKTAMNRLMARSLLEDGEFVRLTHQKFAKAWMAKFAACIKAAGQAGELRETPVRHDLSVWFVHHIGFALMLHLHPKTPAIKYRATQEALIEQATWFALFGVGIKEEAIKRYYNPAALSLLAGLSHSNSK